MNAEQLYQEIKDALRYFGLRFGQMDQMAVRVSADGIDFLYQGRVLHVPMLGVVE